MRSARDLKRCAPPARISRWPTIERRGAHIAAQLLKEAFFEKSAQFKSFLASVRLYIFFSIFKPLVGVLSLVGIVGQTGQTDRTDRQDRVTDQVL